MKTNNQSNSGEKKREKAVLWKGSLIRRIRSQKKEEKRRQNGVASTIKVDG